MKYTPSPEPKRCQRCHQLRTDYTRGRKSCDRCLVKLAEYQKIRLTLTKVHRTEHARQYRKTSRGKAIILKISTEQKKKSPEKHQARYLLNNAKTKGLITVEPCNICNAVKVEAHHPNYSKPLDVIWLCKLHHTELHHKVHRT